MISAPPIVIIGAGGIVRDAHLPAYRLAGYDVHGIFDLDHSRAASLAGVYGIPVVYTSLSELIDKAPSSCIFDLAIPGSAHAEILALLPVGSFVLMQKPMGEDISQAKEILHICRNRKLVGGVNFQLRYAPYIVAAREMIASARFGELCDVEINVNVYTPWHLWKFLDDSPRVEILYHSIHYIDLVRSFLGNPLGIYARTTKHPSMAGLASVRSNIIMDYGEMRRANILTNHCHKFGPANEQSYIKFEGTGGAVKITMGLLMDYPKGRGDRFEYILNGSSEWKDLPIEGSWFPHAFAGSMSQLMLAAESGAVPDNSVEDAIYTMAAVEAAHQSSAQGGVSLDELIPSREP